MIDAPDSAPSDGVCAAAGSGCSLRAAVMEASALDGPDNISLPAGVYSLTLTGSGPLVINGGLAISGAGQDVSVIDGSGVAAAGLGIFNIPYDPARPPVVFSGLTLRKARRKLLAVHLEPRVTRFANGQPDRVIAQKPRPGVAASRNMTVRLVVGRR